MAQDSAPNALSSLRQQIRPQAGPQLSELLQRFFKTGPGQYAEGDKFLGLKVPQTRSFLPLTDALEEQELLSLLHSEWHEERLLALLAMVRRFAKAKNDPSARKHLYDLYLSSTQWVNNWDLVDTSAPAIVGGWLLDNDRSVLVKLAGSRSLWERRIAVLATQTFIRAGQFDDTLRLVESLLSDKHDLMHKACGWMLREVGKRNEKVLTAFLDAHAQKMPRTMLRYAIERLKADQRASYLGRRTA